MSTPSPKKRTILSPARGTRSSPRKKAWKTPEKAKEIISTLFSDFDFSPLDNKSWSEITEEDESLNRSILEGIAAREREEARENRRKGVPKKNLNNRPKFEKKPELSEVVMRGSLRRSQRTTTVKVAVEEPKFQSRKRQLSTTSTITTEEGCSPSKRAASMNRQPSSGGRPARKTARPENRSPARQRLFGKAEDSSPSSKSEFSNKDFWEDPTLGWCTDDKVLTRRTREIERAKEKPVYEKYLEAIPKLDRQRGLHPRTPNKHINFSRRSWDQQVRIWKRKMYDVLGMSPSDSVNTSFCSFTSEEMKQEEDLENKPVLENLLKDFDVVVPSRSEADAMASMLGRFDMDTRRGDESTLKAPTNGNATGGPTDFSALSK